VFEACYLQEERMAKDHRRPAEEVAQGIVLDDPVFLREIVERVLQELLEAEMTEHVGAAPTSALPSAKDTATATSPAP
jgi:transposase-like protein